MSEEPKRGHFAKKKGEVVLREHEYDGIQEYDQKLPNWWLFTFYGAIVWFVCHWVIYYQNSSIQTPEQQLVQRMQEITQVKAAELEKTLAQLNDSVLVHDWAKRPEVVAAGQEVYTNHCSACHGVDLSATNVIGDKRLPLPGLPLNDRVWKFGGRPMDIFKLINEGSPPESNGHNGARMQVWGKTLSPKQIAEVTAYLISELPQDFKDVAKQ